MTWRKALFLGLIQGLTEFLPVSSSGHLAIFRMLLGEEAEGDLFFGVILHLGTLFAVLISFREDVFGLFRTCISLFRRQRGAAEAEGKRLFFLLLTALLPMAFAIPLEKLAGDRLSSPVTSGAGLLLTSIILCAADRIREGEKSAGHGARLRDALFVGAAELLAVTPGVSRSGTTMAAGMMRGFSRDFAIRFSFLLSIPTILAAFLWETVKSLGSGSFQPDLWGKYAAGFLTAAVVGFFAIRAVRFLGRRKKLTVFSVYCAGMGLFTLAWCFFSGRI